MPKVNVDITLATHEEVAAVLADFGITGLQKKQAASAKQKADVIT